MKTGYKVSDIMTASPVKIEADSTVQHCAEVMKKQDVGSLIVVKNSKFVGILTDQDIIFKVVLKDTTPSNVTVEKIMTPFKDIVSIEPNKDIYDALVMMKENELKRLPVMTGKNLQGLITNKDILKIQPDLFDLIVDTIELREEKRKLDLL